MKDENLVHLKFERDEALTGKREILYSEKNMLDLIGIMKRYKELRLEELRLKSRIQKKMKETISKLQKLREVLPHPNVEKILNKKMEKNIELKEEDEPNPIIKKRIETDENIDLQLRDIQRKLNELSK